MPKLAAKTIVAILFGYGIFQIALILSAPWGRLAWGGQQDVLPTNLKIGSAISIALYIIFALIILERVNIISIFKNKKISYISTWVVTVYLFSGVLLNAISQSMAERIVQTPVVLILFLLFFYVARSDKPDFKTKKY